MATARLRSSGKWEICLRHPDLPGGRKFFSFDTEQAALSYAGQWKLMKMAGINPPAELTQPPARADHRTLGLVIREFANSGLAAPTQQQTLSTIMREVGDVRLADADYRWADAYVRLLKVEMNLSPNSIRHRVQALGRSIDEFLRRNEDVKSANPMRLLPKGYSSYSDVDRKLVEAADGRVKVDAHRDRRLLPGEEAAIVAAMSGAVRPDRERPLQLEGGNALLTMFTLIVNTGLRLKEAYTLTRGQVNMAGKVIRAQSSKQWRGRVAFRDVPIPPLAHAALMTYLSTREIASTSPMFPFWDPAMEQKKATQRLSDRFRTAFQYAGCDGLHEHDLRHEACCRWFEMRDASGNWMFRDAEINRIMGWAPGSTMAGRYASFRGADLADRMWAIAPEQAKREEPGAATLA